MGTTTSDQGTIAPATGMGPVHLSVTDGPRSLAFWRDVVGLTARSVTDDEIRLGTGSRELVVLHPGATEPAPRGRTGLYHLAILLPNRRELARAIARLLSLRYPNYPTDHVITETTYLWDPDGNGIELYADTPEDGVQEIVGGVPVFRDANGVTRSGREPLDLDALFENLEPGASLYEPMPDGTKIGHVHLHVANIEESRNFYRGVLGFGEGGFASTFNMAMVSAGGYHHHIGLNTWAGEGAPAPPPGASGLRHFTIELPTRADFAEVVERLTGAGVETTDAPEGSFVTDPSSNRLLLAIRS